MHPKQPDPSTHDEHQQPKRVTEQSPRSFQLCLILALLLGVLFRFINLDQKPYGNDEAATLLRLSGSRDKEVLDRFSDGHETSVVVLQQYQRLRPERGLMDTVYSLESEPQHVPAYFALARLWAQWFGTSATAIRSLPALMSLLLFPCLYWICRELFGSALTGWTAMALVAVSPLHVAYAQEARPYALFSVAIVLSSAVFLRAMRVHTTLSWGLYAATVAFGLYAYLLSGLVVIGHGIYVATLERFRVSKRLLAYVFASLLGLVAFAPWLLVVIRHRSAAEQTLAWQSGGTSLLSYVQSWAFDFGRVFFDLGEVSYTLDRLDLLYLIPLTVGLLSLPGYSLYFLCRYTPRRVWLFIVTLVGCTAFALVLTDLGFGRQMSVNSRYLMACYLGIQLAVSYFLAMQVSLSPIRLWRQRLGALTVLVLVLGGLVSCAVMSQADVWWTKLMSGAHNPSVARTINQARRPLVLSDDLVRLLSLSHLLEPKVTFRLSHQANPTITTTDRDVFVYAPSQALREALQDTHRVELVDRHGKLWRLLTP
jgi:uncharacterized membrane protein